MIDKTNHQVFISYATPDRERVFPYFDWIKQRGIEVWMDCNSIKPGQNWDFEIRRALDKSVLVVAFVSRNSYSRRGYVQRELKIALDKLSEKLVDDIYIVPVLLDDGVEIPEQLKAIQCISDSDPRCKEKVSDALTFQLGRLGLEIEQIQREQDLYWSTNVVRESWDGLPGYEFEVQLLTFTSNAYPNIGQVGDYLRGHFLTSVFRHRAGKLAQAPDHYNYGQDKFLRTNTYDAHCGEPSIKGRVMTVQYAVHWYGAGAAHPNLHFETFSFILEPLTLLSSLGEIFSNPGEALSVLQKAVREQLYAVRFEGSQDPPLGLEKEWVDRGTSNWENFDSFVFGREKVSLLFAPYSVAAYACGPQFAEINYQEIVKLMRPEIRSVLGIEYLAHR